jgi:hypothetical protein
MRASTVVSAGATAEIANKRITCCGVTAAERAPPVPARWGSSILDVGLGGSVVIRGTIFVVRAGLGRAAG